jgi:galactokinase
MTSAGALKETFEREFGVNEVPLHYYFAPGHINLIGEHIDYNGGYVFPAALSLGIYGMLRFRQDRMIALRSTNTSQVISLNLDGPMIYSDMDGWGNYPKGIIKHLLDGGFPLQGCDVLFSGNLPDGAGLSSSAALLVLTAFMLRHAHGDQNINRVELATFCQRVENQFINVNCGIMDQFAVALGRKDCAILLDCKTLQYQYVPIQMQQHSLVIMNTNKKRELSESKYNHRRSECDRALAMLRKWRKVDYLCNATIEEVSTCIDDPLLARRAHHVITEHRRVIKAVDMLQQGNITACGNLMTQSHLSLKDDYEVSGPELDAIVEAALKVPGCIGARMTGAGFGGCAIALVECERVEAFKQWVRNEYFQKTGLHPDFYVAGISDGVKPIVD